MPPQDPEILKWWPTTQSLDLVEGSVAAVGAAVRAEVERYTGGEVPVSEWKNFGSFSEALSLVEYFTNIPTIFLVMPTVSKWVVVWNNSFLCDGYASLCHNLTRRYGFTSMHWSAHDELTTFQSGATFTFGFREGAEVRSRSVYVGQNGGRWEFHEAGSPLAEEDVSGYLKRRKRDRLNESRMLELLAKLGARPWSEEFYSVTRDEVNVIRRSILPEAVRRSKRTRSEVLKP